MSLSVCAVCVRRILGTPNEEVWPGVTSLQDWNEDFPFWPALHIAKFTPGLSEAGIDLPRALAAVTSRPAGVLGLGLGRLVEGAPADLCIFDAEARWTVMRESLRSQGRNSPFLGREVTGRVRYTVIDGHLDFEATTAA